MGNRSPSGSLAWVPARRSASVAAEAPSAFLRGIAPPVSRASVRGTTRDAWRRGARARSERGWKPNPVDTSASADAAGSSPSNRSIDGPASRASSRGTTRGPVSVTTRASTIGFARTAASTPARAAAGCPSTYGKRTSALASRGIDTIMATGLTFGTAALPTPPTSSTAPACFLTTPTRSSGARVDSWHASSISVVRGVASRSCWTSTTSCLSPKAEGPRSRICSRSVRRAIGGRAASP